MPTEEEILQKLEEDKLSIRLMNEELNKARGGKEIPKRLGLILNGADVLVINITKVELFHADLQTVTVIGEIYDIKQNPDHLEIHNVIAEFLGE